MKFLSTAAALSVITTALAATDYKTVVADIAKISKQLTTVNSSVSTFTGGPSQAIQALVIQSQTVQLDNLIVQAGKDAKASPAFGDDGSDAVAEAVLNLQPSIYSTLDTIVRKKPAFDKAIFPGFTGSSLVLTDLKQLKKDTDVFANNVAAKLNSVYSGLAPVIIADIDQHFNDAIATYSKK